MATNYERGRSFEYKVRDHLLKTGAVLVVRAAQSKGKVDLAVFWPRYEPPWLVQCKRDGRLPADEQEALIDIAERSNTFAVHAYAGPKGRGVEFEILNPTD
jgi:hypothetical protein